MTRSDIRRILDFFSRQTGKQRYVQFTGGEPTRHEDFFDIVRDALQRGYVVRLMTNGLRLAEMSSDELAVFRSDRVMVKVSLDGWDAQTHEYLRAPGTFSRVVSGIHRLRSVNGNIGIKTVIHERNYQELNRMLDVCLELGARGFSYNRLRHEGDACLLGTRRDIPELLVVKNLVPFFNQTKYRHLLNGTQVLEYYLSPTSRVSRPGLFYVDYDGRIFPDQSCREQELVGMAFGQDLFKEFDVSRTHSLDYDADLESYRFVRDHLCLG